MPERERDAVGITNEGRSLRGDRVWLVVPGGACAMTMSATSLGAVEPRPRTFRWPWLWGARTDLAFNLLPFWLGFALVGALWATRSSGAGTDPMWTFSFGGREVSVMTLAYILYGPLVDGPHLFATVARTYTDREEWATRRTLFLVSLLAFALGPVMTLAPYLVHAVTPLPAHTLDWGWSTWGLLFGNYALYHISKQHWGFVCLYRRKGGEDDPRDARADALFFHTAIWLPYLAMLVAPWENGLGGVVPASIRPALFSGFHVTFVSFCVAYAGFQLWQWRRGKARNASKLVYVATVVSLYYVTFACDARIAAFWVLITGTGHCAQYHAVVWAYGKKRYAHDGASQKSLPQLIFGNFYLYAVLAVVFALVSLQGPGANAWKTTVSDWLQSGVFAHVLTFLSDTDGKMLGVKVLTAFIAGFRLHHFYVDSKIWRASKDPRLAKQLG